MTRILVRLAAAAALTCGAAACSSSAASTASGAHPLTGVFRIDPGSCSGGGVTAGSSFRMIQPGGRPGAGPFVQNGDSPCADKSWTPLSAGTDGGLRSGAFQPQPPAPFDPGGNALAAAIARPQAWFAVKFGVSTNPTDPQTKATVPAPALTLDGRTIGGQLEAVSVAWNGQQFNQGAPKPGGATPGLTSGPHGSYDPTTHAFTLDWASQIVGGPFNNFTGVWHLTGTFQSST